MEAPAAVEEPAAPTGPADEITLRLSWRWKTEFAPIVLADDMGFFEEQNIDVDVLEGKGSGDALPLIATKQDDFAYLNLTTVAIGIAKDMPLQVVASTMGKNPMGLAYFGDLLAEPVDLEGKTIAMSPGEAFYMIYPAFAEKWSIDQDKVNPVTLDYSAKNQAFLEGDLDVMPVYVNNELPLIRTKADQEVNVLMPAEWGFNLVSNGLITHDDTVAENPDLVRRVVAAVLKGYQYAVENPDAALDAIKARSEELADQPQDVLEAQLQATLDMMMSESTTGHPHGWMSEDDWNYTLDLLYETGGLDERPANEDVFTNEFIPVE